MTWHIINQVWGEAYVEVFLTYGLPTLLAPGNLPALCLNHNARYKLYTYAADLPRLLASPRIGQLQAILPVDFIEIDSLVEEQAIFDPVFRGTSPKFAAMGACHWHAIHRAWEEQAILSFTSPDVAYSDGTFRHLGELADHGQRSALLTGIHARMDTLGPALLKAFPPEATGAMVMPARRLVALSLANQHPFTEGLAYNPEGFHVGSFIQWRVDQGQLLRCWHMQPAMLLPRRLPLVPFWSVDNDYLDQVLDGPADVHVIDDSDDGFLVELIPLVFDRQMKKVAEKPFSPLIHALDSHEMFLMEPHWGRGRIPTHLLGHRVRLHAGGTEAFQSVEAESDRVVGAILGWIAFLEANPAALDEMARLARSTEGRSLGDYLERHLRIELKAGRDMTALGRWDDADLACQRAAALAPGRPEPLIGAARLRLAQGQPREALVLLREALALAPSCQEAWYYLDQAAAASGDEPARLEARRWLQDLAPETRLHR